MLRAMHQMPSRAALERAIRYLLQLGVELENGMDDEDRAKVLSRVVGELERHREEREHRKRSVLVAELVPLIMTRLEREHAGHTARSVTCAQIVTWLRLRGIRVSAEQVAALLKQAPRRGAQARSQRERLVDQVASLIDTSQSALEKLTHAMASGAKRVGPGPLGSDHARARAAADDAPPTSALVEYVADLLGVNDWSLADIEPLVSQDLADAKATAKERVQRLLGGQPAGSAAPHPQAKAPKRTTAKPRSRRAKPTTA
jgi:hypothetical protein